ncbi:efflux RND transporter periplasmic adaptor subunit [Sphingobacterium sp. SRCM116780]|uniref:efflux RND transporter periplasmic adaptor subunit n=1 Tax=Sphingobacterium sp. SRCM116780 TaxID=2907623 RepID=UPI001F3DC3B4|nr:efflux RND transporter periplasmic adaptor subunit [Sphingobacterium sp. SRCM116780]UIR57643.1 efflux RND transporter periplasmic adaptor subunit [Sphingobacterium sp. SRCM116780]
MNTANTRILFSLLLSSSLLATSCSHNERKNQITVLDTIPVTLMVLQTNGLTASVEATGVFTTDDETLLSFKNGGIVEKIFVKEGDTVSKGQLLARVNTSEINAKAAQAKLGYEKAKRDFERASKLYYDSVATLEQMQNAKTALEVAKQDLNTVQVNQNFSEIRSNSNGYVLAKLAQDGQVVGPGTPILQVNGAADDKWKLKVGVADRQWAGIQVGDAATIISDALGNQKLIAFVSKKSEGIDPKSGTFSIELMLKEVPKAKIAAGLFAKATILSNMNNQSVWHIPYESLLDGDGKEGYVFITEDNKTAKRVKVQVASIDKNTVTIVAGLENAQALIVAGSPYLVDGSPIQIKSKK